MLMTKGQIELRNEFGQGRVNGNLPQHKDNGRYPGDKYGIPLPPCSRLVSKQQPMLVSCRKR
jgi:hypothetical protein